MPYNPPSGDAINFDLETFTPPAGDSITLNFEAPPIIMDGGVIFGGTFAQLQKMDLKASGGVVLGGTSQRDRAYTFLPSGGMILGGIFSKYIEVRVTGAAGLILGGASEARRGYSQVGAGGLISGGTFVLGPGPNLSSFRGFYTRRGRALASTKIL